MEAIPVLLTLSGSAHGGAVEEEERVDLMTTGLLYPLKEGWKLTYTETQPDDDATSDITLLIGKGRVLMSRSGDYGTTMVFRKDHRVEGAYPAWGADLVELRRLHSLLERHPEGTATEAEILAFLKAEEAGEHALETLCRTLCRDCAERLRNHASLPGGLLPYAAGALMKEECLCC